MAAYLVQNETNPVSSVHPLGVHIEPELFGADNARDAFVAAHPAAPGDVIRVIEYGTLRFYTATNVLQYPASASPELPPAGE